MDSLRSFVGGFYSAIADIAQNFLTLEIIPGLHMYTVIFIGLVAMVVTFFVTGGEST